jgi:hypothetical protein
MKAILIGLVAGSFLLAGVGAGSASVQGLTTQKQEATVVAATAKSTAEQSPKPSTSEKAPLWTCGTGNPSEVDAPQKPPHVAAIERLKTAGLNVDDQIRMILDADTPFGVGPGVVTIRVEGQEFQVYEFSTVPAAHIAMKGVPGGKYLQWDRLIVHLPNDDEVSARISQVLF